MGSNKSKRQRREKEVSGKLYFIVRKGTDEIAVNRMFETADKAKDWLDESMMNEKLVQIKEVSWHEEG